MTTVAEIKQHMFKIREVSEAGGLLELRCSGGAVSYDHATALQPDYSETLSLKKGSSSSQETDID